MVCDVHHLRLRRLACNSQVYLTTAKLIVELHLAMDVRAAEKITSTRYGTGSLLIEFR